MKRLLLAALLVPLTSFATTRTVDYSDLWFNPNESGWGANVIQQDTTLFVTLFVYGSNNQPAWYVASAATLQGSGSPTATFSGTLYRTSGPYFGASAFSSGSVQVTPVGTFTFSASQPGAATLSYTVDGVAVTKSVVRQTWDLENLAGTYLGASTGTWSACGAGRDGYVEAVATYTISHDGGVVQIREDGANFTCTYTGNYSQAGRLGAIQGGGICTDGVNQTFSATEIQVSPISIAMRANFTQSGACRFTGRIAAVRRGP